MLRAGAHLREEDILRLLRPPAVPDIKDDRARAHLSRCEACAEETVKLERFLDGLSDDHDVGIGDRVSPERLNRQKHRILRRIRLVVEPGVGAEYFGFLPLVGRRCSAYGWRASGWAPLQPPACFLGSSLGSRCTCIPRRLRRLLVLPKRDPSSVTCPPPQCRARCSQPSAGDDLDVGGWFSG